MERIYTHKETDVSLYEDTYDTNGTPYIIMFNNRIVFQCDNFTLAYMVYNDIIARQRRSMK